MPGNFLRTFSEALLSGECTRRYFAEVGDDGG
jgi:hypothetical protein